MEVSALSEQLLTLKTTDDSSIAVIDVRDGGKLQYPIAKDSFELTKHLPSHADHIGGHIKGSKWIPSHQFDEWLPTLLRQLENTKTVVFHCALSKQRGPSAALKYIRAREGKLGTDSVEAPEGTGSSDGNSGPAESSPIVQKVCVLRGGFQRWQESHGTNEQLTEAYVKDLWEDY